MFAQSHHVGPVGCHNEHSILNQSRNAHTDCIRNEIQAANELVDFPAKTLWRRLISSWNPLFHDVTSNVGVQEHFGPADIDSDDLHCGSGPLNLLVESALNGNRNK